jgi:membrane-associated protease RseP (regulator of RpoE activity)
MFQKRRYLIHISLFIITFFTTTMAGSEWAWSRFWLWGEIRMSWDDFVFGLQYSVPFLFILSCHEFGHYFTARYHQIKVTLPFYIPFWWGFFFPFPSIGTMGAFISIQDSIKSRKHYFDVGISGPIAGFVVALAVLWYGFTHLPETSFIYEVHPEYELFGENFEQHIEGLDTVVYKEDFNPARYNYEISPDSIRVGDGQGLYFGDNLLMMFFRSYVAPDDRYVPSHKELMHYPWLLAGFLALFFTALNLLPIGQLDGGHVIFGLLGPKWHRKVSSVLFTLFLFYAGMGWVKMEHLSSDSVEGVIWFLLEIIFYLYILYISTYSLLREKRDRWMFAAVMLLVQFLLSTYLGWEGYRGWLLFGLLLGRFIGIQHPPVVDNRPLSPARKLLGWLAVIIFILCFSPEPLVLEMPQE